MRPFFMPKEKPEHSSSFNKTMIPALEQSLLNL